MKQINERAYWLLIAARVYTRLMRSHLNEGSTVQWSAPADILPGDLALLYEMGKPEMNGDLQGRMQIDWLLRATSHPRRDKQWRWVADYEGVPLPRSLSLAEAKKSRRFAEGPGRSLQGRHRRLDRTTWNSLVRRIDKLNAGFDLERAVGDADLLDQLFASGDPMIDPDHSDERDFAEKGMRWLTETHLQKDAADLIQQEGWASQLQTPATLGLALPGASGYHLASVGWYVDDILELSPNHLLVVEYEKQARGGGPDHGVRQAHDYRRELRRLHQQYTIDAAVIAADFDGEELAAGNRLEIECLRIERSGKRSLNFTQVDRLNGPVRQARNAPSAQKPNLRGTRRNSGDRLLP